MKVKLLKLNNRTDGEIYSVDSMNDYINNLVKNTGFNKIYCKTNPINEESLFSSNIDKIDETNCDYMVQNLEIVLDPVCGSSYLVGEVVVSNNFEFDGIPSLSTQSMVSISSLNGQNHLDMIDIHNFPVRSDDS